MIESALLVLVPEAEPLVGPFRAEHDPAAAEGIPAHVTVLYPFVAPADHDAAVDRALAETFASFAPFEGRFAEIKRLPGVLTLAPEPAERFRELTVSLWQRFPDHPPYGGKHPDIVPHLTIGLNDDETALDSLERAFAVAAADHLPISSTVRSVALMDNSSGRWAVRSAYPLG